MLLVPPVEVAKGAPHPFRVTLHPMAMVGGSLLLDLRGEAYTIVCSCRLYIRATSRVTNH